MCPTTMPSELVSIYTSQLRAPGALIAAPPAISRRFALGSRSDGGGEGSQVFCELKVEQAPGPQPSRPAREAVPGAESGRGTPRKE